MNETLFLIKAPFICLVLLFWYKTNFVWVYGKALGLGKILKIDRFEDKKRFNPDLTYQAFIATNYLGFIPRLLSCSVCLATWLAIIACVIECVLTRDFNSAIIMIPANAIFGIIYFFTVKKIM